MRAGEIARREGREVRVQLAGVENDVLGLKSRLHRKLKRMRSVDPVLASLALTVYEMASGMEAEVRDGTEGITEFADRSVKTGGPALLFPAHPPTAP